MNKYKEKIRIYPIFFIISLALINLITNFNFALAECDQAPIGPNHLDVKQAYKEKYLMVDGSYNLTKLNQFLDRLKQEKIILGRNLYESKLLLRLELEVRDDYKKWEKKARDEMDPNKNALLQGYDFFLIPKVEQMIKLVKQNAPNELIEPYWDDFIRLYIVYFHPNYIRGQFIYDQNYFLFVKEAKVGWRFYKNKKYVEAINLRVEEDNAAEISSYLGHKVDPGHFLTAQEVEKLRDVHHYDLSKINPGESALWERLKTPEDRMAQRKTFEELYPTLEEKTYFSRVRLGGAGSPKITGKFKRNGKKVKMKIKFGWEVHTIPASSYLLRFIGLNQDTTQHREEFKLYLKKGTTYKTFIAEFTKKYGNSAVLNYVASHGWDGDEEYITFNDVLLQINEPGALRLESVNPRGWDLDDRREYRGMLLLYGWLNLFDTKAGNFRGLLYNTPNGYKVRHRIHDVGASLGRSAHARSFMKIFREFRQYGPDLFEPSFMDWNENKVKIWWSDFSLQWGHFKRVSYYDVKWMARQIAQVTDDEIFYSLRMSGMPEQVIGLLKHKICKRQNEVIKAFNLQDEYPLKEVPDLKTYSPNEAVKNGRVVVDHFEGHNEIEKNRQNLFTILSSMVSVSLPQMADKLSLKVKSLTTGTAQIEPIEFQSVRPGFAITIGREVNVNQEFYNANHSSGGFYVRDTLGIEINLSNSATKQLFDRLPAELKTTLTLWKREFQHVHYAKSLKEGYLSNFKLFNILRHFKHYIAFSMNAGETIKVADSFGFNINAKINAFDFDPVFLNQLRGNLEWHYVSPAYFHRDQFGQLKVYKEKSNFLSMNAGLSLAEIGLFTELPLLGFDFTYNRFWQKAGLYSFKLPAYSVHDDYLDHTQRKRDYKNLLKFLRGRMPEDVVNEMNLVAKGKSKETDLRFLYYFYKNWKRGYSSTQVKVLNNGKYDTLHFHRYYRQVDLGKGMRKPGLPRHRDFFLKQRLMSSLVLEMNAQDPKDFVIFLRSQKYYRSMSRSNVLSLIKRQNKKFSLSDDKPFYQYFSLPPSSEVLNYRKVYAENYVYFKGEGIVDKLLALSSDQFYQKAFNYFLKTWIPRRTYKNRFFQVKEYMKRLTVVRNLAHHFKRVRKYKNSYNARPKKFIKRLIDFMETYDPRKNGVGLIRDIVGKDQMFVMGQIYGINRSFTTLQRTEDKNVRRFAGNHWGKYMIPPVKRYLRWHNIVPLTSYIESELRMMDIFGELPKFTAPMQ